MMAKNAHAVTMPAPNKTDGWKNDQPFDMMFLTATEGIVNGMQYEMARR